MSQPSRPNIVFIVTDTQGREVVSAYGERPGVHTPHIDRLAAQGVLFENSFATCPLCTPARSAWYTGLHPDRSGACCNDVGLWRDVPTLAELLAMQGYETLHMGKWHLHGVLGDNGTPDGGFAADAWYDVTNFLDDVGREGINRFGGWNKGLDDIEYCFAHRLADRAIDALKARRSAAGPFFLVVSFDEPHGPYICPPPFRGRTAQEGHYVPPTFQAPLDKKPRLQQEYAAWLARLRKDLQSLPAYYDRYYDCNSFVDYEIGRVLDAIDRNCADGTVVIYTSDHGDHLGAFGLQAKGPTMYDHTLAVPLIIGAVGMAPAGRREPGLVSSPDIWATLLDLAGLSPTEDRFPRARGYTGRSLLPVLRGEVPTVRDAVFAEWHRFGARHSQDDGFYPIRCIRTAGWKLSVNLFDTDELYNLADDPEEAINLIDEPSLQGIRTELHDRLLRWQDETNDVYRGSCWATRPWRPDLKPEFAGLSATGWADRWGSNDFR